VGHRAHRAAAGHVSHRLRFGNRWSAAALAAAFLGARRFTDMLNMMGAPPAIVSGRLRTFCELGVLEPVPTRVTSGRVEYRFTDKGRAFFPHIMIMLAWGDKWFRAELHGSKIQVGGKPPKARETG
jgi:DNA-binding HxlR family transcriptional regulator